MDKVTNDDDLVEILSENVSLEREEQDHSKYTTSKVERIELFKDSGMFEEKLQCQAENQFIECDIEDYDHTLNLNKRIISFLLDLKKHITSALERCEQKLTIVETNLRKHTIGDAKVWICNAGIPYFKDRDYFYAPNNEDETLKETQKELQLRNLPKVSPWSPKERNILLKAIQEEAIADMLCTQKIELTEHDNVTYKLDSKEERNARERFPPRDLKEMIGLLQEKEFNWFKISSNHFEDIHSSLDCCVMWNVFLHPDINKNCWTRSEDSKLKEIARKYKFQNWDKIASELSTNRTGYQCFIRCNTTKRLPKPRNCVWENKEDKRLLKLVEIFKIGDFIPWGEVASWMRNRTKQQVYFRWIYSLAPNLTKGRFSKSEDNVLKDAVTKYGTNFHKISVALMPSRSTVQLHDRYQLLTTNRIKDWNVWTLAEDSKLLELFECFGPNWSKIAESFSYKTRTQLRHRHAALQRYINRGISIFDLNRNHLETENQRGQKRKKKESCEVVFNNGNSSVPNEYCNDNVDKELIEYFRMECTLEKIVHDRKFYTVGELRYRVTNLYSILRLLNTKFCIPNDVNDLKVNYEDKQLLCSLREYINTKNDKGRYLEIINKCSSRMFGTNYAVEEGSRFVPPLPFDSRIKFKKSNKSQCIDYDLNTNSTFLADKPINFSTPDYVISQIGGNEQELQFQKISHLFELNISKGRSLYDAQNLCTFPVEILSQQQRSSSNNNNKSNGSNSALQKVQSIICSESASDTSLDSHSICHHKRAKSRKKNSDQSFEQTTKNITLLSTFESIRHSVPLCSTETTSKEKDISTIEATHATVLSFKNLMYLKQWNERRINLDQFDIRSKAFRESFNLLETRLVQLFKYPIVLSKTVLPEVYVMDTFSYDDVTLNRETSEVLKILEKPKKRNLRS